MEGENMGYPEVARSLAAEREGLRQTQWQNGQRSALRVLTALVSAFDVTEFAV
jgi:hypothetical protein